MASIIGQYRNSMLKRLPESDDNLLFKYHKQSAEMAMKTFNTMKLMKEIYNSRNKKEQPPVPPIKEAIGEAFMDMIDLNWKKCEEICRETLDRVESGLRSDDADGTRENYWPTMKKLSKKYNDEIGESLHSKMQFIRLEYLDGRQDKDVDIMMLEMQEQATEAGANAAAAAAAAAATAAESSGTIDTVGTEDNAAGDAATSGATTSSGVAEVSEDRILPMLEDEITLTEPVLNESIPETSEHHLEKELKLRMTWGRVMIFWRYWIDCRMKTIDLLNKILDNFNEEILQGRTNPVKVFMKWIVSLEGFDNISLQFAHTVNIDFSCYKVLHRKLTEFLDLVTASDCLKAFDVEPKDLFFNISTFQTNISAKQCEACNGFEMCEKMVGRKQERHGEMGKLLACTSRPLLHLKDLLRNLSEEGKLNQVGIKGVVDDLQQEETDMLTMFSDCLLAFNEVFTKVNNGTEQLQKDIKEWLPRREKSIVKMKEIIEKLNKTTTAVSILGGTFVIVHVGVILSPFVFGTSLLPSAIAAGVVSGIGAATAIHVESAIPQIVIDIEEMKAAIACFEKDKALYMKLANQLESSKQNFTMFLRYIPEDELEPFISVMIDSQSIDRRSGISPIQIDPQIALNAVCCGSFIGKAALMPVTRMAFTGAIVASKIVLISLAQSIAAIGVALDVANLVMASMELEKGAKSENAEKLADLVKEMEEEKRRYTELVTCNT